MQIIKVLATDSTNTALRDLYRQNPNRENCAFWADHQKKGKGQRGSNWYAEPQQNLTFSILINNLDLQLENRFKVSALTSLAIVETLKNVEIPELSVKWPNDILSGNDKIAGVLIENILSERRIKASVIGIGLNVNQKEFASGLRASSLALKTGQDFSLDNLFHNLIIGVEEKIITNKDRSFEAITAHYYSWLFRYRESARFILPDGKPVNGVIDSITNNGLLNIRFSDGIKTFDIKEVKMDY